ncbi:MAG TPA: hypothetical protein VNZ86_09950, partial [Bacteroidia bacterium]|nr:hypothetical protein [Bacteroidia bacterium]
GTLGTTNGQTLTLGSSSTGDIAFQPGGQAVGNSLYLASNGLVGIGTTTPAHTLEVNGITQFDSLVVLSQEAPVQMEFNNSGAGYGFIGNPAALVWSLGYTTGGTPLNVLNWTSGGNVGIGTISPVATLDVRGNVATNPIASFSGATTNAGLIVDQSGTGDLFTASKSGATKFVITNVGNVGIGTATPSVPLEVNGNIKIDGSFAYLFGTDLKIGSTNGLHLEPDSGSVTIGPYTGNPLATLDIRGNSGTTPVTSVSGNTAFANTVIDQSGVGDLFSASKSGATKFTILNNGNIQANNYNSNNGLLYTNGSGVFQQLAIGGAGNCLMGGASLTWSACAAGTNLLQENLGALSPSHITDDLLLGGTSTASA